MAFEIVSAILVIVVLVLGYKYYILSTKFHQEVYKEFEKWREREIEKLKWKEKELEKEFEKIKQKEQELREEFEKWKERELETIKRQLEEAVRKEFEVKFKGWKQKYEEEIREDAIKRSISVILGKVGEQLAPILLLTNYRIESKDIKFLGSPIDYIVFKGLSRDNIEEVWFVEVKYGETSSLTKRQRQIKEVIEKGKVKWITLSLKEELKKLENNKLNL